MHFFDDAYKSNLVSSSTMVTLFSQNPNTSKSIAPAVLQQSKRFQSIDKLPSAPHVAAVVYTMQQASSLINTEFSSRCCRYIMTLTTRGDSPTTTPPGSVLTMHMEDNS